MSELIQICWMATIISVVCIIGGCVMVGMKEYAAIRYAKNYTKKEMDDKAFYDFGYSIGIQGVSRDDYTIPASVDTDDNVYFDMGFFEGRLKFNLANQKEAD